MRLFLRIPVPFLRIPVPFRRIPVDSGGITGFRTESVGHQKVQHCGMNVLGGTEDDAEENTFE